MGSLLYSTKQGKILQFVAPDTIAVPVEVSARFLSVDSLTGIYPELTPYQFASNTPINSIDLDGLEAKGVYQWDIATVWRSDKTKRLDAKTMGYVVEETFIEAIKNSDLPILLTLVPSDIEDTEDWIDANENGCGSRYRRIPDVWFDVDYYEKSKSGTVGHAQFWGVLDVKSSFTLNIEQATDYIRYLKHQQSNFKEAGITVKTVYSQDVGANVLWYVLPTGYENFSEFKKIKELAENNGVSLFVSEIQYDDNDKNKWTFSPPKAIFTTPQAEGNGITVQMKSIPQFPSVEVQIEKGIERHNEAEDYFRKK